MPQRYDAIIIGGGFYGISIALYLRRQRGLERVLIVEQANRLCARASYGNQARVHNGYHYPRSLSTALRSRVNLPRFRADWPEAVVDHHTTLYAIARQHSKVSAAQFVRFCRLIGAPLREASSLHLQLFESRTIEAVFQVDEPVFDGEVLARLAQSALEQARVELRLNCTARQVRRGTEAQVMVEIEPAKHEPQVLEARWLFNCTYSGLNQLEGEIEPSTTGLKHELAELALLEVPPSLQTLGVTVMDGPFFSLLPFPSRGLHSLSHVRYTPHLSWADAQGLKPYARLASYQQPTHVDRMLRDAARYLPALRESRYVESIMEVKTVLQKNEQDDGRPILLEQSTNLIGAYHVLGGKLDNVYDILQRLDAEPLTP